MNKKIKCTIKWLLITTFTLILLIAGTIAFVLNVIFTPSKLTPLVTKLVNENLDAKLSLSAIDITFYTTFPNFSLIIEDGSLTSLLPKEELKNDTIVSFKRVEVVVNPIALVKDKKIEVKKVDFTEPKIFASILPNGEVNWDIIKSGSEEIIVEKKDSVTSSSINKLQSLSLSNVRINDGTIIFDNRLAGLYLLLENVTMSLDNNMSREMSDAHFALGFKNGLLWQKGKLIFKDINFDTKAILDINTITKRMVITTASVDINDINFVVSGDITPEKVNMNMNLKVNSLESILSLASFVDQSAKVKSNGEVKLNVDILGAYKNGAIPTIDFKFDIIDANLHYDGFENGIDRLNLISSGYFDLAGKRDSYIDISDFSLNGASTEIEFSGRLSKLLKDPNLRYSIKSSIDYTELAKTLPIKKGIYIAGEIDINSTGELSQSQLEKGDYANISANADVEFKNVKFTVPTKIDSKFDMLNVTVSKSHTGLLAFAGGLEGVYINLGENRFNLSLDSALISASGVKGMNKREAKPFIKGNFEYSNLKSSLYRDSVEVSSGVSDIGFSIIDKKASLSFLTDKLLLRVLESRLLMSRTNINIDVSKESLKGVVDFSGIDITTPLFPLKMSMPATKVTVNNQDIKLNKAVFKLGDSDLVLTGEVVKLLSAMRGEAPLTMKVNVSSSMLNLTQIVNAINQVPVEVSSKLVTKGDESEDSTKQVAPLNLFRVPKNIDFELNTSFKRVELNNLKVNDIKGEVTIKEGVAKLNDLKLETLGAEMGTTIMYDSNESDDYAKVGIILNSESIDVNSVIKLVPSLDTLMPMLNSFEGKLNFSLVTDTKFYEEFTINPKDIRATVSLEGENLVVLDGKTFAEISKMLMFKNKSRNKVDSISVQLTINDGKVEVFPFIVQVDRYKVALGGEHYLDNNFNYHISVLKSPIPIKFGVNITGSLDDMKIRVGKTKYKYLGKRSYIKELNPEYIKVGENIMKNIFN